MESWDSKGGMYSPTALLGSCITWSGLPNHLTIYAERLPVFIRFT